MSTKQTNTKQQKKNRKYGPARILDKEKKALQKVRRAAKKVVLQSQRFRKPYNEKAMRTQSFGGQMRGQHFRVSHGAAPEHQEYGPGVRVTVEWPICTIGRTGLGSQGSLPPPNLPNYIFRKNVSGGTFRYDSMLFSTPMVPTSGTSVAAGSDIWRSTFTNVTTPVGNYVTEILSHYSMFAVRSMEIVYTPSASQLTNGSLVFGVDREGDISSENSTDYNSIMGLTTQVHGPLREPMRLQVLRPYDMSKAPTYMWKPFRTGMSSQFILVGACDTVLASPETAVDGELWGHATLDAYAFQWIAELTTGLSVEEKMIQRTLEKLMAAKQPSNVCSASTSSASSTSFDVKSSSSNSTIVSNDDKGQEDDKDHPVFVPDAAMVKMAQLREMWSQNTMAARQRLDPKEAKEKEDKKETKSASNPKA